MIGASFGILPVGELCFLGDNLFLFVSRTPDTVTNDAVGLRELPDNPVVTASVPARLLGRSATEPIGQF
jgi:hypothetical protein